MRICLITKSKTAIVPCVKEALNSKLYFDWNKKKKYPFVSLERGKKCKRLQ